ncbi:MAG: hypothetical protein AVDCRST_MAG38-982 [uncultured Solirubrobacteraceae bacterium]|uniref:NAD(P)-binding domain-containing protein n=1 Tax=uncultured Solirubrobacteraceae bacterium TaxID=1162706 RepID=A0A6J4R8F3_9ACTN|nr:MAG: hypothetical protein AVDCRST_MAG38-982 [uncultured Solirubrobacteraceae bacterium]
MARVLIVGCGCRGRELAAALTARGHTIRGTSRDPASLPRIAAAGAEPALADPDRIGTLMEALAGATVVCWLMGSATGDPAHAAELHDGRLSMLFERIVDTPVRGVLHEAAGPLPPEVYARATAIAAAAADTWQIPVATLTADPREHAHWLRMAVGAVEGLLTPPEDAR